MPQYRKKPIVIEAVQWTGRNFDEICNFMQEFYGHKVAYEDAEELANKTGELYIKTLEGIMTATKGDYIIKGIKGEYYPCKPDVFEATYEDVSSVTITPPDLMSNIIPNYPLHNYVKSSKTNAETKCTVCGLESWQHYKINFK